MAQRSLPLSELADEVSLAEWKVTVDTARARVAKGKAVALSVLRAARLDLRARPQRWAPVRRT